MNNLSSTHYAPGSVLATGNIAVKKNRQNVSLLGVCTKGDGEWEEKTYGKICSMLY